MPCIILQLSPIAGEGNLRIQRPSVTCILLYIPAYGALFCFVFQVVGRQCGRKLFFVYFSVDVVRV